MVRNATVFLVAGLKTILIEGDPIMKLAEFGKALETISTFWDNEDRQILHRLDLWIATLPTVLAWRERVLFRGMTLKPKGEEWLLIVRARRRQSPVVAFFDGREPIDCFMHMATFIRTCGIQWQVDRFPYKE